MEVLVSAMVLTIATAGVVMLLQTTTKTQAEQRHNTEAYAVAQEDQARLSTMRLSTLNQLNEERTVTLNRTNFKVLSRGVFINDLTSKPTCGEGTSSADYVEITSVVTWTGMNPGEKAKIVSILSPSNGSLDPNNGTLAFSVKTQLQAPVAKVGVSGGSGAFARETDAAGCAVVTDLPAGKYNVTVSGANAGVVNKDGKSSVTQQVTVVAGKPENINFEFDRPGAIPVSFKYRVGSSPSEYRTATADSVVAFNSGMETARIFKTAGGLREPTVQATGLFPFSSKYSLYAGSCASNSPDPLGKGENPAGFATAAAPAGDVATPSPVAQIPALELTVKSGSANVEGARVTLTDLNCTDAEGKKVKRVYTSNEKGLISNSSSGIAELGVPFGSYEICASAKIEGTNRRKKVSSLSVKNLAAATIQTIDLGSGYESGQTCS